METPVSDGESPRCAKRATRGSPSSSARATRSPETPSLLLSHMTLSDGVLLESPSGWVTAVRTPSTVLTRSAMRFNHDVHFVHSASWSRFIHISTAMSIAMASSLPTFIPREKP